MQNKYLDIGKGKWRKTWITKTDMVDYLRCKYRFFLSFYDGIPMSELIISPKLEGLLYNGLIFDESIIQKSKPLEIDREDLIKPLIKERKLIKITNTIRNHEIGIKGIPDLIETEKGKLIPIEIKWHKEVTHTDILELAFYWLLLEPLRKKFSEPKGYVELNTGEREAVSISDNNIDEVERLVGEIRALKKNKPNPSLTHECNKYCALYDQCREFVAKNGGLTSIFGISATREQQLNCLGINNFSDLIKMDQSELNIKLLTKFHSTPGEREIENMKYHAISIRTDKPYIIGDKKTLSKLYANPLIVFDLEYNSDNSSTFIWLIGLAVKTKNEIIYKQFFAEKSNSREEKRILNSFINFLDDFPSHKLITWSGNSADMPQLSKAWKRLNLNWDDYNKIDTQHIDLCKMFENNLRLPCKSFKLDEMEKYFNLERQSEIIDGFDALCRYYDYTELKQGKTKDKLKKELMLYNLDDINSTLGIFDKIPELLNNSL